MAGGVSNDGEVTGDEVGGFIPSINSTRSPDGKLRVVVGSTQRSARTRRSPDVLSKSMELGEVSAASPGVSAQEEAAAKAKWRRKQTWNIIAFSLPALSIVLVDPLMTLLDTVLIGQFSSTDELAALGPNTLVFNSAQWIFNSLAVGTTSIIVNELKNGRDKEASDLFTMALWLGLFGGVMELVAFKAFALNIIRATGAPDRLIPMAARYMDVRATAAPAVLVTLVVQAAMLAQKDATTPFRAVMVCGAVKAILNVTLLALDRFGAVESAVATVVSQFLAMALLLRWNAADGRKVQWNWSVRPGVGNVAPFAECLGPLTGVYVLKNVCYVLVNSAATSQVFLAVAAHQSMYSVWVLLAFCATPLERAAISFLPTAKPGEVVELEELLAGMALGLGAALGAVCAAVALLCPDILSQDERVWEFFAGVAPQAFLSLTVNALDAAFNGILLARRDFTFLLSAMAATMVVLYAYNSWLVDQGYGLPGVWWGLVLFVVLRWVAVYIRYRFFVRK